MKKQINNWTNITTTLLMLILISSCASTADKDKGVPIYQDKDKSLISEKIQLPTQALNNRFVRTQGSELINQFPVVPNPVLNLFVYPHLSTNEYPVPGYTTVFRLYKEDHYALPNEIY